MKISKKWLPITFISITGGFLILMIFITLIFQIVYINRVYPGLSVDRINAGGMTLAEITTAIKTVAPEYLADSITIQIGDKSWRFSNQELGIQVDVAATAAKVYAAGRRGDFLADMFTHLTILTRQRKIDPVISYDTELINKVLQKLADEVNRPPQNAGLTISPQAEIGIIPARRGIRLHIDGTRTLIEKAIFKKDGQPVTAITQEVIPAIPEVGKALQQAKTLLSQPLIFRTTLVTANGEWQLKPPALAELIDIIEIVDKEGQPQLAITLNPKKFRSYLDKIAVAIYQEPVEARLEFNDDRGELIVVQESKNGYALDIEDSYKKLEGLIENSSHLVELSVLVTPPTVSSQNIESLGINQLVSRSTSYFKGSSSGRTHNIILSASKFQGVVIPPNQIFSFNKYLGEISKETGFDESLIILGNRTAVGIGGGVCQVSTTVFRAAFLGGFEIVERWAHGYRVGWYETNSVPGLDATIYTPDLDIKFRNDTGNYLLIQTVVDKNAGTLTFSFYGTDSGKEVIISKPVMTNLVKHGDPIYENDPTLPKGTIKQVDWANDGLDVTITRLVKNGDTIVYEDTLFSHYQPWQAVYKVGTGIGGR